MNGVRFIATVILFLLTPWNTFQGVRSIMRQCKDEGM